MLDMETLAKLAKYGEGRPTPEYAVHLDAWQNGLTGVGTARDKVTSTIFQTSTGAMLPSQLEDLYHNDDVAARICDLIPETALREPFQLSDAGLQKEMYALDACDKFESGWTFGRLYGGGPVILGGAGPADQQLTSGVNSLMVVDRWTLYIHEFYTDTNDPKYGYPKMYRIMRPQFQGIGNLDTLNNPTELIHESRVIVFPGARTSPRRKLFNGYWDDSVLQRVYQVLMSYGLTWASVTHLLQDAAQGVYAMKDLWNMIVGGNKQAVEDRMKVVDEQRSSARMMLVDADNEKFTRVPTPFAGIPDLIDRISLRLSSASGYPLTVLMGSSPGGMNATGQSDLEIYYGRVEVQRRKVLTPAVMKLAAAMGRKMDDLTVTYPPLWMPTAKEVAETRYTTAQADNLYMQNGLPAEVVIKSRFRATGWSPETDVPEGTKITPPAPDGPPGGDPAAGASGKPGSAVGTHHYSKKYGR